MSRIDELIRRHCPNGVEFKPLGEVSELVRGNGMPRADFSESGVGAIHYGQIYTHYGTWATGTISFVPAEKAAKLAKVNPGDIIITNTSENLEDVGKAVAWLGDQQIVTGGHATVIKHSQDAKYIAYWLQSPSFHLQKRKLATGTKVIDVSARSLAKVVIPVPPIEVQREVVRILDTFSKLEAELEARRKQYTFYRDTLVQNDAFPRHSMGSIGEFIRGKRFTKKDIVGVGIPAIHYGDIYTHYGVAADSTISHVRLEMSGQLRYANPGDVVIATVGETVEDVAKAVAWLGREQVAIHDDTFLFRSKQNPKYISYAMQTAAFHAQKRKHVARGKVKRTSGSGLGKVAIPVPELHEQERIVGILDKFDALVNDLSAGLPAELRARRQQYEHYRDRLLNFKDNPNAHAGSSSQEGNPPWEWSGNPLEERIGPGFPPAEGIANGSRSDSPPSGSPPSGSPPLEGWQAKPDGVVP